MALLLAHRAAFTERGAQLVFVGNGDAHYAAAFARRLGVEEPVLIDESRVSYQALGLRRDVGGAANFRSVLAAARSLSRGHLQRSVQGDALQLGGVFVVDTTGAVCFAHASRFAGDHPSPEAVLAALP